MSVTKLNLVNIIGPISEFDNVVESGLLKTQFQPENPTKVINNKSLLPFESYNPNSKALEIVDKTLKLANILPDYKDFSDIEKNADLLTEKVKDIYQNIVDYNEKVNVTKEKISQSNKLLFQLEPLKNLEMSVDEIFSLKFINVRFGKMPLSSFEKFKRFGSESNVLFESTGTKDGYIYGFYFCPSNIKQKVEDMLNALYFERIWVSEEIHSTPAQAVSVLNEKIENGKVELKKIKEEMASYVALQKDFLLKAYSRIKYLYDCHECRKWALHSESNFYISGWVDRKELKTLEKELSEFSDISVMSADTHENSNITPPTKLKNPWGVKFFEFFVEMYGLPSYNELDPTLFVALTYTIFFGIMFGDVGQGLTLFLVGLFMAFKLKMPLGKIISVIGVSSCICGFFYGSVFGNEEIIKGFSVLHGNNTIFILLFAAGLGLVLIASAMIMNIINGFKQKDLEKILFSPNGLCGFILFFANVTAGILMFTTDIKLFSTTYVMLTTVLPIILIFLRQPLAKLLSGKKDWMPKKIGEYLTENLFELFEVALSFLSNTISYVRIGAFAVSHAGMMLVVTSMAQMTSGVTSIIIMIFGNILVMALEGIIVGIQVLRLEFYEFFSRFYSGEGKPFNPVKIKYN